MSYWSHNPELLDEVTINALPDLWKEKVENEEIELEGIPEKIRDKAMLDGTQDHFEKLTEGAMNRMELEEEVIKNGIHEKHS